MDALSAVRRAGECDVIQSEKLEEATAWAGTLGRWFQQARMDKVRVLGTGGRSDRAAEADLPLSLCAESRSSDRHWERRCGRCWSMQRHRGLHDATWWLTWTQCI